MVATSYSLSERTGALSPRRLAEHSGNLPPGRNPHDRVCRDISPGFAAVRYWPLTFYRHTLMATCEGAIPALLPHPDARRVGASHLDRSVCRPRPLATAPCRSGLLRHLDCRHGAGRVVSGGVRLPHRSGDTAQLRQGADTEESYLESGDAVPCEPSDVSPTTVVVQNSRSFKMAEWKAWRR